MKNFTIAILILCIGNSIYGQIFQTQTEKLATTAKVWGFLKYYHPEVANGEFNWDNALFEILPRVKESKTKEQLSQVYVNWIESLGKIEPCDSCKSKKNVDYFDKNFDLSWIDDDKYFTSELTEKLRYIETNRHQGEKYYASVVHKKIGNVKITNEENYDNFDWTNENLRLLALFRYWNSIEYFFPYKYQTDVDWDDVLTNMIPKFLDSESETEFHLAMLKLVVSIDDSHAGLRTPITAKYFGNKYAPIKFKIIDKKAIVTGFFNDSLARLDDLKVGDIITKINDEPVHAIFQKNLNYLTGSNLSRKKANANYYLLNGNEDSVQIEFIRNNRIQQKSIKRYAFKAFDYDWNESGEKYKILDGNIGYVNMGLLEKLDSFDVMKALKNTRAIIFDIRNYPNGTLYAIANHITSSKGIFYKVTYPDLDYPGRFIWREGYDSGRNGKLKYNGEVVLLVDENSISHSEFTAMCLQRGDKVTTIGSQTAGADGNISRITMVGGFKTAISGIGIFYPDGYEAQRNGVKIDIEVKPTLQGIIEGKDEVLEKAIDYVNTKS